MGFTDFQLGFVKGVILICLILHELKFQLFGGGFMCPNNLSCLIFV